MSVRSKAIGGLAVLALAGGMGTAGALAAGAATSACGTGCMALFTEDLGSGYVTAVAGGAARIGRPVILSAAADSATEDWQLSTLGTAADLYAQGLVTAAVAAGWGPEPGYEIQYTPGGVASGRCLGLASAARNGARVSLQACGVSSKTIWIADVGDRNGRFEPLIPGSNNSTTSPLVLTGSNPGRPLVIREISGSSGTIAPDQMWQAVYGPLS